ncbi:MAG TPA: phosphatase PAP2 family protein [Jatrophihabitantaceae bacterium]
MSRGAFSTAQLVRARRLGPRARLAVVAAFLAFVPFTALLLLVVVGNDPLLDLDSALESDMHGYAVAHPGFTSAMRAVSTVATPVAWWAVLVPLTVVLLVLRQFRSAAFVPVTFLSSVGLNRALKALAARPRPVLPHPVAHAGGFSFPSGHAQAATVGCGIVLVLVLPLLARTWRITAIAAAALVAATVSFSRIALGVHFMTDVVGGLLVGACWVLAMAAAFGVRPTPQTAKGGTA